MLCYVMLCYVMLCYVMLCYVMLCYVFFSALVHSIGLGGAELASIISSRIAQPRLTVITLAGTLSPLRFDTGM